MLQFLRLIPVLSVTSILLITEAVLSYPLTSNLKSLALPASDRHNLICYMQTGSGVTLNLTNLCRKVDRASQVIISNVTHDSDYISGQVINRSTQPAYQVKVNYEVLDQNDSVIKSGSIPASPSTLKPGETASFDMVTSEQQKVRATFAESAEQE